LDESLLSEVLHLLSSEQSLAERYFDHALGGEYDKCRDCHILPDWILIYQVDKDENTLYLIRTGTHSDLFR
jgi:mRNA interferase YafQ